MTTGEKGKQMTEHLESNFAIVYCNKTTIHDNIKLVTTQIQEKATNIAIQAVGNASLPLGIMKPQLLDITPNLLTPLGGYEEAELEFNGAKMKWDELKITIKIDKNKTKWKNINMQLLGYFGCHEYKKISMHTLFSRYLCNFHCKEDGTPIMKDTGLPAFRIVNLTDAKNSVVDRTISFNPLFSLTHSVLNLSSGTGFKMIRSINTPTGNDNNYTVYTVSFKSNELIKIDNASTTARNTDKNNKNNNNDNSGLLFPSGISHGEDDIRDFGLYLMITAGVDKDIDTYPIGNDNINIFVEITTYTPYSPQWPRSTTSVIL